MKPYTVALVIVLMVISAGCISTGSNNTVNNTGQDTSNDNDNGNFWMWHHILSSHSSSGDTTIHNTYITSPSTSKKSTSDAATPKANPAKTTNAPAVKTITKSNTAVRASTARVSVAGHR